jgi:hypothetical protein
MEVEIWQDLFEQTNEGFNLPSRHWLEKLIELWLENLHVDDLLLRLKTIDVVVENHM